MLGLGISIMYMSQGITGPIVAMAINRKGVKYTFIFGTVLLIIGNFMMATIVSNQWMFIISFGLIIGTGLSFGGVMTTQSTVTFWFDKKKTLALSLALSSGGLTGIIIVPLITKMISNYGWKNGWMVSGILSVCSLLIVLLFIKNRPEDIGEIPDGKAAKVKGKITKEIEKIMKTEREWSLNEVLRTKSLWLIIGNNIAKTFTYSVCLGHAVIHLIDKGHPTQVAAVSISILTFSTLFGKLGTGFLGDKYIDPKKLCMLSNLLMAVGVIFLLKADSITAIYLYAILVGIGFGLGYIATAIMISNFYGAKQFPNISGISFPISYVIGAIGPFLAGVLYDFTNTYTLSFIITWIILLIGMVGLLFAKIDEKPKQCS